MWGGLYLHRQHQFRRFHAGQLSLICFQLAIKNRHRYRFEFFANNEREGMIMFKRRKKYPNNVRIGYVLLVLIASFLITSSSTLAQQRPLQPQMQLPAQKTITTPTQRLPVKQQMPAQTTVTTQKDSMFPNATKVPAAGFFTSGRPKLIVLVHGATDGPENMPLIGKLQHARYYWGFRFVCGLMGGGGNELFTLSNYILNAGNWKEGSYTTPVSSNLPNYAVEEIIGNHLLSNTRDFSQSNIKVLLTHRDGSKSLEDQADAALNQIFELYNNIYRNQNEPQIILLAHSMGGLVSRYILSDPYRIGTRNSFRANFIRNRTLCLITLATPHEGSPLAAIAQGLGQLMLNQQPPYIRDLLLPQRESPLKPLVEYLGLNRPSLVALRVDRATSNNQTIMAPFRAQRADQSLIPIYVLSGRDPSGGSLNNPNLQRVNLGNNLRDQMETAGLVLADQVFKNMDFRGWGPPPAGFGNLDKIQRVSFNQIVATNVQEIRNHMDPVIRQVVDRLGGIIAISGIKPFDVNAPLYLNQKWTVGTRNVQVPFKHWECGNYRAPWDDIRELNIEALVTFFRNLGYDLGQMVSCMDPQRWTLKDSVWVPTIALTPMGSQPPSDREFDNDGLVGIDSGVALHLGQREAMFFDHTRLWQIGTKQDGTPLLAYGSWYRYFDGPFNSCNHGLITRDGNVGQWLYRYIIRSVGPVPGAYWISLYPGGPRPAPPANP